MIAKKKFLLRKPFLEILFIFLVFVFFLRVVVDPDLGWHLMTGKYIWETKTVPQKDLFSFSLPDYPYVYHSWLTDFLLYLVYKGFGLWGVTFFYCFLAAISLWLILKTTRLRVKADWVYLFLALIVPVVFYTTYLRTQLFTLLGLSGLYFLFRKYLEKETDLVLVIPLLFLVWANFHGGFFLGLVFFAFLLLIEILNFLFQKILPFKAYGEAGGFLSLKKYLKLGFVFGLSAVSSLVNPYGIRVYQQALRMGTNQFAAQFNIDWYPLVTAANFSWLFAVLIFGAIVFLVIIKNQVELREKLLILAFFGLALRVNRFSLPLVVALIPAFIFFVEGITKKAGDVLDQMRLGLFLIALFLMVVFFGRAIDYLLRMEKAYSDEAAYAQEMPPPYTYPQGAVDFLSQNQVPERLFNDSNWGGYLIWKLPERKYFIDGRMDNFFVEGEPFAKEHWKIVNLDPDWQLLLEKYQIEAILVSSRWPVAQALRVSDQWRLIYEDQGSVLFEKVSE